MIITSFFNYCVAFNDNYKHFICTTVYYSFGLNFKKFLKFSNNFCLNFGFILINFRISCILQIFNNSLEFIQSKQCLNTFCDIMIPLHYLHVCRVKIQILVNSSPFFIILLGKYPFFTNIGYNYDFIINSD